MTGKKIFALMVSMLLVSGILFGCGSSSPQPAAPAPAPAEQPAAPSAPAEQPAAAAPAVSSDKPFVIGFSNANDIYPYLVKVREAIKKYAAEAGMEVLIADAAGDLNNQTGQIENFQVQGANLICVVPTDSDGLKSYVEEVQGKGIPFLTVCGTVGYDHIHIGSENVAAGEIQAEYLAKVLPENGTVCYLVADQTYQEALDRKKGFMKLFDLRPDVKLLSEQVCENRADLGMDVTESWIQSYDHFDAICAQNDDSALGAIEALKGAQRLEGVTVVGLDGSDDALKSIQAGEMKATAFQDADGQAKAIVEIAKQVRDGKDFWTIDDVIIPFKTITVENVSEYIK